MIVKLRWINNLAYWLSHLLQNHRSKITSIVVIATAAALLASSIAIARKCSGSSSSGSSKSDYDKFQKCLSDDETGGSATNQQIKDCFSSICVAGSSSSISSGNTGNSVGSSDSSNNPDNTNSNN
ncbi:MAG: hypothetical protein WA421_01705 [Nitrososphaeraceae archaeon]